MVDYTQGREWKDDNGLTGDVSVPGSNMPHTRAEWWRGQHSFKCELHKPDLSFSS